MGNVVLSSFIAGVVGTGIGGCLGVIFSTTKKTLIDNVIAFAGGVMLAIVFFDLLPESMKIYPDPMVSLIGFVWGIVAMYFLSWCMGKMEIKNRVRIYGITEKNDISEDQKKRLKKSGVFMCIAIALHNIPEGLAVGATSAVNVDMGIAIAVIICLHNIPEGIAISLPLTVGGMGKIKAVFLSMLAGSMTIVGGLVGNYIGGLSVLWSAFSLAFAGGAMLNVVLKEMLHFGDREQTNNYGIECLIAGVVLGFLFVVV